MPGGAEYSGAAIILLTGGLLLAGRRFPAGRLLVAFVVTTLLEFAMKTWLPTVPVPDELARHVAWLLVEQAMGVAKRRRGPFDEELEKRDEDWLARRRQGRLVPGE